MFQKRSFWFFCFTIIFLLSLDFWHWQTNDSMFLLYLPSWIFYFVGLQVILTCVIYIFALKFWETPSDLE